MSKTASKNMIDAVGTTLDILDALRRLGGAGVTDVARETGFTKGTVHNHLSTLARDGYVIKDADDRYQIGLRFMNLAYHARERIGVYDLVREEVDTLAARSGEMALFTVEEHGMGVCVYRKLGPDSIQTYLHVGHRNHLHHTAVGKAILAHLPDERVAEIIADNGLPERTENTVTDPDALVAELAEVREQGVAYNHGETITGLVGVGAPIIGPEGTVVGAISIIGPTSRLEDDRDFEEASALVKKSKNIIEINATSI